MLTASRWCRPFALAAASLLVVPVAAGVATAGQDTGQTVAQTPDSQDALRVFLDCGGCDLDYLRTELTFINYVRDRRDAQVHVLVTDEDTGGGGEAVTLDFVGLEEFTGDDDQVVFFMPQDSTDDDERRLLAQRLGLGLARYAAKTPLADRLVLADADASQPSIAAQPEDDPWNFWFFRTEFDTEFSSEERETTTELGGSFSANRTTDQWKINLGFELDYQKERFELSDGERFINVSRDNAIAARVIKSLGEHWGVGMGGSAVTSTFRNLDLALRLAPAVEYNFYPYSESTRRQFTIRYAVGVDDFRYDEPTIFGRTSERRPSHNVVASIDINEPWGETELAAEFSQFLDDRRRHRAVLFGDVEIRLFRGFSLDLSGDVSLIRDQIFLPRRGATDEEILVRRRQLATDYEFSFEIGITYVFGSIYNNVVNSRFDGSSGGFIRAF